MRPALLSLAFALLTATSCGGGGGTSLNFDPAETTPTLITAPGGRITAEVPPEAYTVKVALTLTDRSDSDRTVPGPAGRTLVMAMELSARLVEAPAETPTGQGGAGGTASRISLAAQDTTPPDPAAAIEITFKLPSRIRPDLTVPVYSFNSVSGRYEAAGFNGALSDTGLELTFPISAYGRYAIYSLTAAELPPAAPKNLRLLAASTQVRRLAWDAVAGTDIEGYYLYQAAEGQDSFTKVNTAATTSTVLSVELTAPGAVSFRVTSVNVGEIESDPSAVLSSPAVDFDVAFTFGESELESPQTLALDAARERLLVADPGAHCVHVYTLAGVRLQTLTHYPSGTALDPWGIALSPDETRLYISHGELHHCAIFDADYALTGMFGSQGSGPGEFDTPGAIAAAGDRVIVADPALGTLQAFTPLGVYLTTFATGGTGDGQLTTPSALLASSTGKLLAADAGSGELARFDLTDLAFDDVLTLAPEDGGPLVGPSGLAEDFRGRLYISDSGNRRVVVLDSSGKLLFHFGSDGALRVEFSETTGPTGLALDPATGYLYVCDTGNHRIAVFLS